METLYTGHPLIARLGDIGRSRAPSEAAGFVFPGNRIIELPNRSMKPEAHFQFNPDDVTIALETARIHLTEADWEDAILWHTHPQGSLGPSQTDWDNKIPGVTHLIVSLTPEGEIPTLY